MKSIAACLLASLFSLPTCLGQGIFAGADESSPSRSHYFTWINNTNEGFTDDHTKINMAFFQWLHDSYGMRLDIYAFDAGVVDAPEYYGRPDTRKFQEQFPNGFGEVAEIAKGFGSRLGMWLGPDGFGDTPKEEQARIDFLTSLARDHDFELFKMDAVCGQLRPEKIDAFDRLMTSVRKHSPDLILLNHRLELGKAEPHATTFLWQGAETYIDVHMINRTTATHNRAAALDRGLPPELRRLAEDHGVCISSCLDYWEDDLILQAFNRAMILAPQLYGSPWFLRDDEYPKLARIFNLHRKYRDILVSGMVLPEETYGPHAVSRGDDKTRLITLRNLTWEPVTYKIALDQTIGLDVSAKRHARLFHPYEEILGNELSDEDSVEVTVYPFRAALLLVSVMGCDEPALESGPFQVIRNVEGEPVEIDKLTPIPHRQPWHRKLADLERGNLPADWAALYEATTFATDNNAFEIRSLQRSGPSAVPAVIHARQAFLDQPLMKSRALWDRYLFDGDFTTVFDSIGIGRDIRIEGGCLRIDFAEPIAMDHIKVHTQGNDRTLINILVTGAEFSSNLSDWTAETEVIQHGDRLDIYPPQGEWRYFRMRHAPERTAEVEGFLNGQPVDRSIWSASNLFAHPDAVPAVAAWTANVKVDEIVPTAYLCVAVEGEHGQEGAYAAIRMGDRLIGAPDRAPSYPVNPWEYPVRRHDSGYTYFFPLDDSMLGQDLEVVLLGMEGGGQDLKPSVWITARDLPFSRERVMRTAE
jgi:hypothetical protein